MSDTDTDGSSRQAIRSDVDHAYAYGVEAEHTPALGSLDRVDPESSWEWHLRNYWKNRKNPLVEWWEDETERRDMFDRRFTRPDPPAGLPPVQSLKSITKTDGFRWSFGRAQLRRPRSLGIIREMNEINGITRQE